MSIYNRNGLGACGHVVGTWPLRRVWGGRPELLVECDWCSGGWNAEPRVWVRLVDRDWEPGPESLECVPARQGGKQKRPRKAAVKRPTKPKPKKPNPWLELGRD